jgi:hypothetical protein
MTNGNNPQAPLQNVTITPMPARGKVNEEMPKHRIILSLPLDLTGWSQAQLEAVAGVFTQRLIGALNIPKQLTDETIDAARATITAHKAATGKSGTQVSAHGATQTQGATATATQTQVAARTAAQPQAAARTAGQPQLAAVAMGQACRRTVNYVPNGQGGLNKVIQVLWCDGPCDDPQSECSLITVDDNDPND